MSNVASKCLHKRFIGSDRVEGTQVLGLDGVSMGKITRLDIDRASGKVTSAFVLRHGPFGVKAVEREVPWEALRFDIATDGFRTDHNKCDPLRAIIQSDHVEGMEMYDQDCVHIGKVRRMLIDKVTGHVECAVVVHHKWLGLGSAEYRVSWDDLHFDTKLAAFKVRDSRALQPFNVEALDPNWAPKRSHTKA